MAITTADSLCMSCENAGRPRIVKCWTKFVDRQNPFHGTKTAMKSGKVTMNSRNKSDVQDSVMGEESDQQLDEDERSISLRSLIRSNEAQSQRPRPCLSEDDCLSRTIEKMADSQALVEYFESLSVECGIDNKRVTIVTDNAHVPIDEEQLDVVDKVVDGVSRSLPVMREISFPPSFLAEQSFGVSASRWESIETQSGRSADRSDFALRKPRRSRDDINESRPAKEQRSGMDLTMHARGVLSPTASPRRKRARRVLKSPYPIYRRSFRAASFDSMAQWLRELPATSTSQATRPSHPGPPFSQDGEDQKRAAMARPRHAIVASGRAVQDTRHHQDTAFLIRDSVPHHVDGENNGGDACADSSESTSIDVIAEDVACRKALQTLPPASSLASTPEDRIKFFQDFRLEPSEYGQMTPTVWKQDLVAKDFEEKMASMRGRYNRLPMSLVSHFPLSTMPHFSVYSCDDDSSLSSGSSSGQSFASSCEMDELHRLMEEEAACRSSIVAD